MDTSGPEMAYREYEDRLTGMRQRAEQAETRVEELEAKLLMCIRALSFYNDPANYEPQADAHGHRQRPVMVFKWQEARSALGLAGEREPWWKGEVYQAMLAEMREQMQYR
jgi:hypothetical protein